MERIKIDVIYAHKFSIEGILAYELSKLLQIPYCLSLWGNTDRKVIALKPNYFDYYRLIFSEAKYILSASPWIEKYMMEKFKSKRRNCILLPVICQNIIECNEAKLNVRKVLHFVL